MRKIKVLYLMDVFYKFAGAERNLYEIVKGIDKTLFTPYVFALRGGGDFAQVAALGVETQTLAVRKVYDFHGLKTFWQVVRFLRREKIDIIVSYHEGADTLAVFAGMLAGVRVLISSRRDMGYKLQSRHIRLYRLLNKFFTRIITVSDAVAEIVSMREGVPAQKLITVYNGVNKEKIATRAFYSPEELNHKQIDTGKILLGVIASFRRIKGIEYFIRAADIVYRANPQAQFLIIGKMPGKPAAYTQELMALAFTTAAKGAILFLDFEDDISKMLGILDIVISPSLSEGFSNTIVEAMAASVPVVATKVGGNVEAIEDGVSGILVPPQDEQALAGAMLRLMENEQLRKTIGSAGRERVQKHFSYEKMIAKTENIYQALLWEKKNSLPAFFSVCKKILKQSAGYTLYYSRMLDFFLAGRKKHGSLIILAYHNVVKQSDNYLYMDVPAHVFQQQLEIMKKYFTIIPLAKAVSLLARKTWQGNYLSITFDDGYKDLYTTVFPLAEKEHLPLTIFVNTLPMETNCLLWFDRLITVIKQTKLTSLNLNQFNLGVYLLDSLAEKKQACLQIVNRLKKKSNEEIEKIISCIEQKCAPGELPKAADVYLGSAEVEIMAKNSVEFGSHSHSHFLLSKLAPADLKKEVEYSKKYLEKIIGRPVRYLAYPNGKTDDFNPTVVAAAKHAHYRQAFSLLPEQIVLPYSIGRYGIYVTTGFSKPLFVLQLALQAWQGRG